jgi:1-acyl-sn-glycerol-3-phosphate acyltransferase
MPGYSHVHARVPYFLLKSWGKKTFSKIRPSGFVDDCITQARSGRLVLLPTHNDMFDTVIVAYPFLEAGMKPPVFHAGDNLRNALMSYFMPKWNVLFVKRKGMNDLDYLVYVKEIEHLLEKGENQTIYPEATRSRHGFIAPVSSKRRLLGGKEYRATGMAKGYLEAILHANTRIKEDIYLSTVTVSSALFPDLYKDLQSTGKAAKMMLLQRLFESVNAFHGPIYVHYGKPEKLEKDLEPSREKLLDECWWIRQKLKENITVLPENLLAYAMNHIIRSGTVYSDLPKIDRVDVLAQQYERFMLAHKADNAELKNGFLNAVRFYQRMGTLGEGFLINPDILLDYNSNRIQHFLKDKEHKLP